ncbi:TIM barrel protein [Arcicella rigui]|uniref:TIM barrel protein n=1 Tax=Arcicella rigui TaxID=797020 RepID=A0ABU5QDR3_9BACT|nr:TIM barrel protein [Arcicella rigui]MEA5140981.1 TIM barrel protein [Arcicella rigui]
MNTFKLKYAPHFGTFASAGSDLIDQIKYSADLGFTAFEDNAFSGVPMPNLMGIGMLGQTPEYLDKIGKTLSDLNMEMGTFVMGPVNWPPNAAFTSGKEEFRNIFLDKCRQAVEVGKRLNGKYVTVVPDAADPTLPYEIQTANVLESLKRAAEIFEPHGMVMLLEPLSFPPQVYLKTSAQCYLLAKAVNSPACKILFDLFHLQQNEGHLQRNIDLVWDEIGYFQIGDVPQRFEPGTGEINHEIVFKHIYQKSLATGKNFIFGMEHYNSVAGIAGEQAMLEAYQKLDNTLN